MQRISELERGPSSRKSQNGRKQTTGKYETREELVSNIARLMNEGRLSKSSIARVCKVSCSTVETILESISDI